MLSETNPLDPADVLREAASFKNIELMIGVAKHDGMGIFGSGE